MKVLLCYESGLDLARELRGYAAEGLDIACVGDADAEGLAAALTTADGRPYRCRTRSAADPEDRRRGEYH